MEEEVDPISGEAYFRRVLDGEMIRREGEYVNGLLEGEVYHYDQNSRLHLVEIYENGKLIRSDQK
jgi:antitoxin component YwqK of YwqJK toxin-antitoxin module